MILIFFSRFQNFQYLELWHHLHPLSRTPGILNIRYVELFSSVPWEFEITSVDCMYFTDKNLKAAEMAIVKHWYGQLSWNFVRLSSSIRNFRFWSKKIDLVSKLYLFDGSVKYTFQQFYITRTRSDIIIFSPVTSPNWITQRLWLVKVLKLFKLPKYKIYFSHRIIYRF